MAGSKNLIVNPTFIWGSDHGWQPLCCSMSISDKLPHCGGPPSGHQFYCIAHNRTQLWQGIAQDITSRLQAGVEYKVEACVSISGHVELADVRATLKLESVGGKVTYSTLASGPVSKREWAFLKGKMEVSTAPVKALVFLEGPPVGVDILASFFSIAPSKPEPGYFIEEPKEVDVEGNVLVNPTFSTGVQGWSGICCRVTHSGLHGWKGVMGPRGKPFALALDRTEGWQGIQQDITGLVQPHEPYLVVAVVRTAGKPHEGACVLATVRLEYAGSKTRYVSVGRVKASSTQWALLQGKLLLDGHSHKAFFYLEGPPSGVDLLVSTAVIKPANPPECVGSPLKKQRTAPCGTRVRGLESIVYNATFSHGLQNWKLRGCRGLVCTCLENPETVLPFEGTSFAVATQRTHTWSGIEQVITGRVDVGTMYSVLATVRISGPCPTATVRATLYLQDDDQSERYITMGSLEATATEWKHLEGRLVLLNAPAKVSVYLEGPPTGTDILVDSFYIHPASKPEPSRPPIIVDPKYEVNIVENHNLQQGLEHWFGQGAARLSISSGAPTCVPPAAALALPRCSPCLSGHCIVASNRTQWWEGPAQTITGKLELFVVYQVSAWVRVGRCCHGQKVNIALSLDGKWVTGGEVDADHNSWKEIMGSFRVEKKPNYAMVYAQGPEPGVDLMFAGLQIFAVDRSARIPILKAQADKIRKRDVVLKLNKRRGQWPVPAGTCVKVEQTSRSFPLGSCLNRWCLDNDNYKQFFLQNFNWAVFENELKWNWTEPQRDTFNYKDADEMVSFCSHHQIPMRGHCIFWEDENCCQDWLKTLTPAELSDAVHARAVDLLSRYKGRFRHYDVNNEMLHGRFYRDRLNPEILPRMFKLAHQFDPEAVLFVNDYHVEDGVDGQSTPDKYVEHIEWLMKDGAPVGAVGVQGHADAPVGAIIRHSLDELSRVGLPIWMTEIDVAASNEHLRADDLEVILRESFAHPSVEGVMLWGFWEGAMSRENGHLVDADNHVNAAGKRLVSLREEWTTRLHGRTDDCGQVSFRGYHGRYKAFVEFGELGEVAVDFEIPKGDSPLVIELLLP